MLKAEGTTDSYYGKAVSCLLGTKGEYVMGFHGMSTKKLPPLDCKISQ